MTRLRGWLAALLTLWLLAAAQPAFSHASLVSSDPEDGAVLAEPPAQVVMHFDEPVAALQLRLVDRQGQPLSLGDARIEGLALHVALPKDLGQGPYLFSYRVASADSHPVGGAMQFSVGIPGTAPAPALPDTDAGTPPLRFTAVALRALRDMALLAAAGAALFVFGVASFERQRRLLRATGIAAAALSVASVAVHGALLSGSYDLALAWTTGYRSSFGLSALAATVGAACIALGSTLTGRRTQCILLGLGVAQCVLSLPLTGHAAAAHPRWLATGAIAAHGMAAAFWFGSLLALRIALRADMPQVVPILLRFSRIATWAVALLLAAGVTFATLQIESPAALPGTAYGRLILLKAGLLLVLLALAGINRFRLMPRLADGYAAAGHWLQRTVAAEIGVVIAVLVATAVLVQTPPHAHSRATALSMTLDEGGRRAQVTIAPGRPGFNRIGVTLTDAQGRPLDAASLEIALSSPQAGIEPLARALRRTGPATYLLEGGELAFPGAWTLEIRGRIDDFEQVLWTTEVRLR